MAVTKHHPLEVAAMAFEHGLTNLGENQVKEAVDKITTSTFKAKWELIGHLQSNKTRLAVTHFHRIQSVDSTNLASKLNNIATELDRKLPILLQVNTGKDPGKHGLSIEDSTKAVDVILQLEHLKLEGLMTIAPYPSNSDTAKQAFTQLRILRDDLQQTFNHPLPELSMGMTSDLEEAIEAGSTCIRIGTALFGTRA